MKKRFLSAGLAVVMAASLTACGSSDSASTTAAAAGESKAEGESAAAGESSAAADGAVFKNRWHRPCNRWCSSLWSGCTAWCRSCC